MSATLRWTCPIFTSGSMGFDALRCVSAVAVVAVVIALLLRRSAVPGACGFLAAFGHKTDRLVGAVAERLVRRGAATAEIVLAAARDGAAGTGDHFERALDFQRPIAQRLYGQRAIAHRKRGGF